MLFTNSNVTLRVLAPPSSSQFWLGLIIILNKLRALQAWLTEFAFFVVDERKKIIVQNSQGKVVWYSLCACKFSIFWCTNRFPIMHMCICSAIDHWWRQNVVRTQKWHTRHRHLLWSVTVQNLSNMGSYLFFLQLRSKQSLVMISSLCLSSKYLHNSVYYIITITS